MGTVVRNVVQLLFVFLSTSAMQAQNAILKGRVYNLQSLENVNHANVVLKNSVGAVITSITTGYDGYYSTDSLQAGAYRIEIKARGYIPYEINNVALQTGHAITFDIALSPEMQAQEVSGKTAKEEKVSFGNILGSIFKLAAY